MEIIVIAIAICLFVFFISTLNKMSKKPTKSESKDKPKDGEQKQESGNDEIPEILKEVTTGNYMYDLAQASSNDIEFVENENIVLDDSTKRTNVSKVFDDIANMGDDLDDDIDVEIDEIDDIEDDFNEEIGDDFAENSLLGDIVEEESEKNDNDLVVEYSKLSKKMKAILMSNALDKKHHD